jgi:hypothetical protein
MPLTGASQRCESDISWRFLYVEAKELAIAAYLTVISLLRALSNILFASACIEYASSRRAAIERGCSIGANCAQTFTDKHRSKGTPAVRALSACARMKGGKDVLWIATPFNMLRPRRDTKDRTGVKRTRGRP